MKIGLAMWCIAMFGCSTSFIFGLVMEIEERMIYPPILLEKIAVLCHSSLVFVIPCALLLLPLIPLVNFGILELPFRMR